MVKILILGTGCFKCNKLHQNVLSAVKEAGIDAEVFKVSDAAAIAGFGVMTTPALIIDDNLVASGSFLSVEKIKNLLGD